MYLILLQYIKPLSVIDQFVDEHKSFLKKYSDTGEFILAGKRKPRAGGMILCKTKSRKAVQKIIQEDPFDKNQLALYDIIEIEPTQATKGFDQFL